MWSEPYLETCCRAALHRLFLAGAAGRPGVGGDTAARKDVPCLERLARMGLAKPDAAGRFFLTPAGSARHAAEILHARS